MKEGIVFITGAHGFIGRNMARAFSNHGWTVIGTGFGEWVGEELEEHGIAEWYPGKVSLDNLAAIGKKPDLVIHCAGSGSVGFSIENPDADFEMTVKSTEAVLEFMRLYCPGTRLIYPSSAAVYGQKEDCPIKEEDELNPLSPYGRHKVLAEELCRSYSEKYGIPVSIVRLFSVYGPGLRKQLLWDACRKISAAEKEVTFFGTGKETRDWINVADAGALFLMLARSDRKFEILNGTSGERTEVGKILELIVREFGKSLEVRFSNENRSGDPVYFQADVAKAREIGWKPKVSLTEGLREYVNFFKKDNG